MKAKHYIGILPVLILTGSTIKAQMTDMQDYRNDDGTVINNYYVDYDYYYSSRINRFHRQYAVFDYYSPLFTDSYWYNYRPFSWGISIYGGAGFGLGFGFGFPFNYPVYNFGYGYNTGWYNPYFVSSFYRGYDPFYFNYWYSDARIRSRWADNYYGWNRNNSGYNNYRGGYHTNYDNHLFSGNSSLNNLSRRRPDNITGTSSGNFSGRDVSSVNSSMVAVNRNNITERSDKSLQSDGTRRNTRQTYNDRQVYSNDRSTVNHGNNNVPVRRSGSSVAGSDPGRKIGSSSGSSSSSRPGFLSSLRKIISSRNKSKVARPK